MNRPVIGVIGAGQASAEGEKYAYTIGRLIAENGAMLVCGGMDGVMQAASRGCAEAGGEVIGILPGASKDAGNPYLTIPIVTNMGHARNIIIAHTADVLIAVEGEYGTLSEMAIGLKLGKTVVQLNSWSEVADAVTARTPEEAVTLAFNALIGGN